jgi:hypothetical protein
VVPILDRLIQTIKLWPLNTFYPHKSELHRKPIRVSGLTIIELLSVRRAEFLCFKTSPSDLDVNSATVFVLRCGVIIPPLVNTRDYICFNRQQRTLSRGSVKNKRNFLIVKRSKSHQVYGSFNTRIGLGKCLFASCQDGLYTLTHLKIISYPKFSASVHFTFLS